MPPQQIETLTKSQVAALLSEAPMGARRVLDLGCGNGHLLSLVLTRCPAATGAGLDFSPTTSEQAR